MQMDRKTFMKSLGAADASITSIVQNGRRRLHLVFPDGSQRIDELDQGTHETLLRKTQQKSSIRDSKWNYEIGEEQGKQGDESGLNKTSNNPIFIRKDTLNEFQWRIRNLNYESSVFQLSVEDNHIVVRTTIKKYYKKISIPDLTRINVPLEQSNLKWLFKNNTLLITYQKPNKYLEIQEMMMMEFTRLNMKKPQDGDIECNIQ